MDIVASPTNASETPGTRLPGSIEERAGLTSSHHLTVEDEAEHPSELNKPPFLKHVSVYSLLLTLFLADVLSSSDPAYESPLRHHKRVHSRTKQVKVLGCSSYTDDLF